MIARRQAEVQIDGAEAKGEIRSRLAGFVARGVESDGAQQFPVGFIAPRKAGFKDRAAEGCGVGLYGLGKHRLESFGDFLLGPNVGCVDALNL